jgi:mRNA-degrading endonuclease toxin of MazEF toxin-antitoxin module
VPKPSQGRIIEAYVLDQQNRNPKHRPLVIVTPTDEIAEGDPFLAVAITGTLPDPLTDEYVILPYHPNGQSKTGLKKKCAAKCDWVVALSHDDITRYIGVVPADKFAFIAEYISTHEDY